MRPAWSASCASYQNLTRLVQYSTELYARLEAETGLATGWKQCGSISVARTAERMTLLRRSAATADAQGVDCEDYARRRPARSIPIMRTDDLVGAVWLPGDGKANPADITQALARGARSGGVRIFEKTRVTGDRHARTAASPACRRPRADRGRGRRQLRRPVGAPGRRAWSA